MNIPNDFNPMGINKESGIPTKGLDFYCPFQNSFDDQINGYHGVGPGTSYFYTGNDTTSNIGNCLIAQCMKKQGINYNNTGDLFQYGTGDFSVSFWLQAPKWTSYSENCVLSKKANDNDTGFVIYRDGGKPNYMTFRLPGTDCVTTTAVQNVKWVSWIFTRKSGTAYWYRNGILDLSISCDGNASSTDLFRVGYHGQWNTKAYYHLKALRIYNRALTLKQINDLSNEFDVKYYINSNTSDLDFFPQSTSQQINVSTPFGTSGYNFKYEITSGTLKYGLTLNQNTGVISGFNSTQVTGGVDQYDITVRISCTNDDDFMPKDITITLHCYKESILTIQNPQTFNFITQVSDTKAIDVYTQNMQPTVVVTDGTLPDGVSLVPTSDGCNIVSNGSQTSASSSTVVTAWTTQYHPTSETLTLNINVAFNPITASDQTINFYTNYGALSSKPIKYTTQAPITPVYTLTGTLPSGITFNSSTGTFSYDGTNTTASSTTVQVTIASSTGYSESATINVTVAIVEGSGIIDYGLDFYCPFETDLNDQINGLQGSAPSAYFKIINSNSSVGNYLQCNYDYNSELNALRYDSSTNMFQYGTGDFAVSFWVQAPNWTDPGNNCILCKKLNDNAHGFALCRFGAAPTKISARIDGTDNFFTETDFLSSDWVHWCVYRSSGTAYWYRNGVLDTSATKTGDITSNQKLYIGRGYWNTIGRFNIKALRIYNRAMFNGQIAALASEFTP